MARSALGGRRAARLAATRAEVAARARGAVGIGDAAGGAAPGDARFDGFWARVGEAGIPVAFHNGDAGYRVINELWSGDREFRAFAFNPLQACLSAEAIHDTFAALICHGVFERHPNVRVAAIECGSEWMESLVRKLKKAYGQMHTEFKRDPVEQLREHCFVAPYYEDDVSGLRDLIGTERILFGSDFPHAEGLTEPLEFLTEL